MTADVLLLIGASFLTAGLRGGQDPIDSQAKPRSLPVVAPAALQPAALQPAPLSTGGYRAPAPAKVAAPVAARSAPVALRIPAIGLTVSVSAVGISPDGSVQVPTDFQEPGWFRLGPSPGQVGSAVILGHVDSRSGPAVFFRLRSLRAGDRVDVSLADGVVAHFVVKTVKTYLKTQFPAREVYASHGYRGLQLITCGGDFDTNAHSYLSNVVAYTSLVGTTA